MKTGEKIFVTLLSIFVFSFIVLAGSAGMGSDFFEFGPNENQTTIWFRLSSGMINANYTNTSYETNTTFFNCPSCINSSDINDVDKDNIEGDMNTFVDIPGDTMTGPLGTTQLNVTGTISSQYLNDTYQPLIFSPHIQRNLSISIADFIANTFGCQEQYFVIQNNPLPITLNITAGTLCTFIAPIHLPQDSIVTAVFVNGSPSGNTFRLSRSNITTGLQTGIAIFSALMGVEANSNSENNTIDNNQFAYTLRVDTATNIQVFGGGYISYNVTRLV